MSLPIPVTALVLTYNEEANLPACLDSIAGRVDQVIVVDSHSTDRTLELARLQGAEVVQHEFVNQAEQLQWALECAPIRNDWVLRLDADERWTDDGLAALASLIAKDDASAVSVRMKVYFMGRWIRHGGFYPNDFIRVFRKSAARVERRWMDEHIVVDGRVARSTIDVVESNVDRQRDISRWTDKHNRYSSREALEVLIGRHGSGLLDSVGRFDGDRVQRKRWMKDNLYSQAPLLWRALLYFLWRYLGQAGFLDGREGLIFHTLQAFWYRFLVDVKVIQVERLMAEEGLSYEAAAERSLGIRTISDSPS